jgi:ADP-ribose pyrophosphatase YjhB (NUDIX family)
MVRAEFLDQEEWYEGLPGAVISAGALIINATGEPLLVKPNYRDYWSLPGGICEHGEAPHIGCEREVAEELGLTLGIGRLLAVDWSQPLGPDARPSMHFVFDGGMLPDGRAIVLQQEELDCWQFTPVPQLGSFLPPHTLPRVVGALEALQRGPVRYLPRPVS